MRIEEYYLYIFVIIGGLALFVLFLVLIPALVLLVGSLQ